MILAFRRNFSFLLLAFVFCLGQQAQATSYRDDTPAGLGPGAGVWANLWNYPSGDLDLYARDLESHGIKNLFIQTSRSTTEAIKYPEKLGPLIDACHKRGVRVIAWSFAELINPELDADKMVAAAEFTSPAGEHIDAIAPNMEKNLEPGRIERYSKRLRDRLGRSYPMLAVVYSPLNRCAEVQRISWPLLAQYYDVIAPMIYWNSKYQKIEPYAYTVETIQKIRLLSGKSDVEIHAIGDGMGTDAASITKFLQACKAAEATGVSLYPNQKMTAEQTKVLAGHSDYVPANSKVRLAAFREFVQKGAVPEPPKRDPSQIISRGDFYQLVVRQMSPAFIQLRAHNAHGHENNPAVAAACREADGPRALQILANHGILVDSILAQQALYAPISNGEAASLLAKVVELSEQKNPVRGRKPPGRLDRWFIPPAHAENHFLSESGVRPLNYFDASHMVLQAGFALR